MSEAASFHQKDANISLRLEAFRIALTLFSPDAGGRIDVREVITTSDMILAYWCTGIAPSISPTHQAE